MMGQDNDERDDMERDRKQVFLFGGAGAEEAV
jgi:hypothetical protein